MLPGRNIALELPRQPRILVARGNPFAHGDRARGHRQARARRSLPP